MRVKILAFGIVKDIVNGSSFEIEINQPYDTQNLKSVLQNKYPRLKELKSFMIAVNEEYADSLQPIAEGDEVAVIPPVSGG